MLKKVSSRWPSWLPNGAANLLRTAREQAGLTQRELALRARTTQSVVARIELGAASPSWRTLQRLVRAAGCELAASVTPGSDALDPSLLDDVPRILRLSPENRLREVAQVSRFVSAARRV